MGKELLASLLSEYTEPKEVMGKELLASRSAAAEPHN